MSRKNRNRKTKKRSSGLTDEQATLQKDEGEASSAASQPADTVHTEKTRFDFVTQLLLSLPILAFGAYILSTGNMLGIEDWDWFFSHTEAVRRTIVEYRQFPWWNPWSSGGVPLFADPQVGLISIQTPFVLLLGTVIGMKVSVAVYLLVGFWGMFLLLGLMHREFWRRVLLSYLFISSTYVVFHYTAGHFTFLLYLLVPLLVYFYLDQQGTRQWLMRFSLFTAFFVNSAAHYIAVQTVLWMSCLVLVIALQNRKRLKPFLTSHILALLLILPLIAPKIIFALEYMSDYPRDIWYHPAIGVVEASKAFLLPGQKYSSETAFQFLGTWEISAYIGVLTIAVFVGLFVLQTRNAMREKRIAEKLFFTFTALAFISFLVGLGPFASFSPWAILSKLPVLEKLQIPSRWFGCTLLFVVLAIGSVKTFPRWALIMLAISLIELTVWNVTREQPFVIANEPAVKESAKVFQQYDNYPAPNDSQYSTMFPAMQQNYGEVRGYEPLIGYERFDRHTKRGGINNGHPLITDNARIVSWSPNKIVFRRTGPGTIKLNANLGRWWTLNDEYLFDSMRVAALNFELPLEENTPDLIVLQCQPQRAWTLYLPLLSVLVILLLVWSDVRRKQQIATE